MTIAIDKDIASSTKGKRVLGIPKLEDANDAGGKESKDCTLILTEGDSAKALAIAGLAVIGRDKYGVFPLRGKLLNVRDVAQKTISENKEIMAIAKILGLSFDKKNKNMDMRYGAPTSKGCSSISSSIGGRTSSKGQKVDHLSKSS